VNDWLDRHVDAINEPKRPIPSGRMPGHWGPGIALMWTALSAAVAATIGSLALGAAAARGPGVPAAGPVGRLQCVRDRRALGKSLFAAGGGRTAGERQPLRLRVTDRPAVPVRVRRGGSTAPGRRRGIPRTGGRGTAKIRRRSIRTPRRDRACIAKGSES
jgi:hypothetical protein